MHEVLLGLTDPSTDEVDAFKNGRIEPAVLYEDRVVMLSFRFGDGKIPWQCMPYSYWLAPESERSSPSDLPVDKVEVMIFVLVDSGSGNAGPN